tara:strand:- start:29177 stop:29863 length:687 start_codon:yes stop_codon:yes gene_type:complete
MIISHKYKFIFIKTAKTAGTSIEVFLSKNCGSEDVVTPIWPHIDSHCARNYRGVWNPIPEIIHNRARDIRATFDDLRDRKKYYNHISALSVRQRIPRKIWDSYFKFCVERNPWDKTLSHYYMENDRSGGCTSFDEYIQRAKFCINLPSYTDTDGRLLVDKVVKYESLADELGIIFGEVGIPFNGSLGVSAKSDHRKDRRPYQEVYTIAQRAIIEKVFSKEIQMHGYVF